MLKGKFLLFNERKKITRKRVFFLSRKGMKNMTTHYFLL